MRLLCRYALLSAIASCAVVSATPGKPRLTVNVRNGEFSGLECLDPSVQWSTSGNAADFDYEIGADLSINPSIDVSPSPKSVFGKISRKFGGWGLSARADVDLGAPTIDSAAMDLGIDNDEIDLALRVLGSAGKTCSVDKVEVRKGLSLFGSMVDVKPRFNVGSMSGDVALSCKAGSTGVDVVASMDEQKFTVSQRVLDNNYITPSFTTKGKFALQLKRNLADNKSITTTIKPNESVSVRWTDGAWVADFDSPIEGINIENVDIKIRRKIDIY